MKPVRIVGEVRFFDPRGWGFIRPINGSADIFFHVSELPGERGRRFIEDGKAVSFEIGEHKGRTAAKRLIPIASVPSAEDRGRGDD